MNEPSHSLKRLQNGTDIRGIAIGEGVNLTEEIATRVGLAFSQWLGNKEGKALSALKVAIGMDSRLSGPALKAALIKGVAARGVFVLDCGLASTPAMFMSTVMEQFACHGAIMVTASHLPFNRNGFKFFTRQGGAHKADILWILENASTCSETGVARTNVSTAGLMDAYSKSLRDKVRRELSPNGREFPLRGLHILVDAGNGAGGFYADILERLGANISGSLFLEPDGRFPNHVPNPEDDGAIRPLQEAVACHGADLGIIFDTDVDRAAVVDSSGQIINRNRLVGLLASVVLEEHPKTTIVTDSITSDGLMTFIEGNLSGKQHRFKRGYRNVIDEAIRLNEAGQETHLAIETSGHAAFKENYFLDDGAYMVTKLLIKLAKLRRSSSNSLASLITQLPEPREAIELRVRIVAEEFGSYGERVIGDLAGFVGSCPGWSLVKNNFEGIRVSCDQEHGDGWFLIRLSLHDPVLPVNIESNRSGGATLIAEKLRDFLSNYQDLDCNALLHREGG
jgi:phosphomannomutase